MFYSFMVESWKYTSTMTVRVIPIIRLIEELQKSDRTEIRELQKRIGWQLILQGGCYEDSRVACVCLHTIGSNIISQGGLYILL
jgi:hypothetical protein